MVGTVDFSTGILKRSLLHYRTKSLENKNPQPRKTWNRGNSSIHKIASTKKLPTLTNTNTDIIV